MQGGERLRRHLREDEDDRGEHEWHQGEPEVSNQADRNQRRHGYREEVDQVVAEEDQPNQPIRPLEQSLGADRTAVAMPGEMPQAVPIERHHAGLGAGEAGRKHDENQERKDERP